MDACATDEEAMEDEKLGLEGVDGGLSEPELVVACPSALGVYDRDAL